LNPDPQDLVKAAADSLNQRHRDRAAEIVAHLLRTRAPLGATWETVARVARAAEEPNLALAAQHLFISDDPNDARRQWELCLMLLGYGRIPEAIKLSQRLIARAPRVHAFHQLLGNAYAQAGKTELALEAFRRGLEIKSDVAESWLAYVQLKTFRAGDPDLAPMRQILQRMTSHPAASVGAMNYALGKALDDTGDVEGAFSAVETGARLIGKEHPYDRARVEAQLNDIMANWNAAFAETLTPSSESGEGAIFVLGLPRSGTTLAEQILVSHSAVAEGAETSLFISAALAFPDFRPSTVSAVAAEPRWNGDIWSKVASAYTHLLRERFGASANRVVDKTPSYTAFLGAIAHALPKAKFIWMRRNPGAVAWSCYRSAFAGAQDWSWSLQDIAHHMRLQDRLFAHWTALFPDRILALQYEDLVEAPDTWIPRLLDFVGLPDEPGTRNFHLAERTVRTASITQVRRPLYTSAISNWRRYEAHLAPFFDAYDAG
jgi:tetratricopeptide (TPR) repeat protein